MKTHNKKRFTSLLLITLLLVGMMTVPAMGAAGQPTVNLGTTETFAVLAGLSISNTGTTIINGSAGGDIGLSPGAASSFTGQGSMTVSGAVYTADAVALQAQIDLRTAYNDAAGRSGVITIDSELGGKTLFPGVYKSAASDFQITGTLTLDALGDPDGVFIFLTDSTLVTASGSNVNLIHNARFCRTFWKVGSSATLGTNSNFVGHIFASESITATTGAKVEGQLMALNGSITLDSNTISNGLCATAPAPATLHVIKHVINDNGRTAVAADFNLHVKAFGIDVATSPASGAEAPGTTHTLPAGTYIVSEDNYVGYTQSYSGDSNSSGSITLASGDDKTVIITNNDTSSSSSNNNNDNDNNSSGGGQTPQISPPLINVVKTSSTSSLLSGGGSVTYTYKVTNPGKVSLRNVSVTDDKVSPVKYVSGDINTDNLLQSSETWIYTSKMNLVLTTTNTATAKGSANGMTATDIDFITVVVARPIVVARPVVVAPPIVVAPPVVVTETVTGGQLPKTSSPLSGLLLAGVALTLVGAVGWRKGNVMKKVKLSWSKHSIVTFLSLGFMILGIGCISWAMLIIQAQSDYSIDNLHPDKIFASEYTADSVEEELIPVQAKALYPVYPEEGDNIGSLTIPVLNREIPIIQGTGKEELKKGVGHFTQSVLPGEEDNCVLSGHRDTVFRKIGDLKVGDQLIVETSAGVFTYEVNGARIVHADDRTVIVPTDNAVLTMTTCYPFHFIGNAPDRYIITADLVK